MDFVCFVDFVSVSDVGAYSDGPSENVCPNAKKITANLHKRGLQ
ncbi:hypothetical protein NMA510612_1310 [Neisseria meningitidis]|uniref:Uncharacterized protein n=4 Tax=Neisseria meningitidis TaxID=487 RepID=A0A0H5QVX7_NEIMI|nr:hypothetical protein NMA510612_1310 [Neisseria meningitidis]CBA03819.1 hypothetical protein predicted by Glimmer/Critica [Neisseria meningitidis alpha153]CBA09545.1 hypothetical protein predicted by Glimmer/Critica [Neisseria meningitidis alpha275]CRY99768.1 hypothetical protein [Neisseria meningitidis serogroup B]